MHGFGGSSALFGRFCFGGFVSCSGFSTSPIVLLNHPTILFYFIVMLVG